jgi:diguanylate cyclase (GGDEF)-like protein
MPTSPTPLSHAAVVPEAAWHPDQLRLRVLSGLSLTFAALLVPLTVYRVMLGQYPRAAFNVAVALFLLGNGLYLRRTGRLKGVDLVMAAVVGVAAVGTQVFEADGIAPWLFPCLVTFYVILPARRASVAAGLLMGALAVVLVARGALAGQLVILLATLAWSAWLLAVLVGEMEQRQQTIESMATRDPLTGAGNRRALKRALGEAVEEQARHGVPASVMLLDLDHFKAVNDRHGHEAGDRLLVQLVQLVKGRTRAVDQLFRLGGEEFVVVMRRTGEEEACRLAESLRALLGGALAAVAGLDGGADPVTASFGCAERRPGEEVAAWLARADAALYAAKRQGRNRVEASSALAAGAGRPSAAAVP